MTFRTRRVVIFAVLVLALTVPAEVVLLQAISQDSKTAAQAWVADLSEAQLQRAADQPEAFTRPYRMAMLNRLGPKDGAGVWQRYLARYRNSHPELSVEQVDLLDTTIEFVRPDVFIFPTDKDRETATIIADRMLELFGPDVRQELLRDLGPRSVPFSAQALALPQRLQDFVREHFVVSADQMECDCNGSDDCTPGAPCDESIECILSIGWLGCGWFGLFTCNGMCNINPTIY